MPLFFVVGGFAGIGAWRRLEASGGTAGDFIRSRILRLARPAIALFAVLALAVLAMHLTGVDPVSIRLIGIGIASPLWFLAAYAFAQAYLPGLATFHAMAPRATLATLAVGAIVCDIVRFATGVEALGLLDMTFVWLFAQQLGFWIADGWFRARSRATVAAIGAGAYLHALRTRQRRLPGQHAGQPQSAHVRHRRPRGRADVPPGARASRAGASRGPPTGAGRRGDRRLPPHDDLPLAPAGARARHRPAAAHAAAGATGRFGRMVVDQAR